jgi:hypothetical protein
LYFPLPCYRDDGLFFRSGDSNFVKNCIVSRANVAVAAVFVRDMSSAPVPPKRAWAIGNTLLLASVLRYPNCAEYQEEFTRHEHDVVARAGEVDGLVRMILDGVRPGEGARIDPAVSKRLLGCETSMNEALDRLCKRQRVVRRRALLTTAFTYFNAVKYSGGGDVVFSQMCRELYDNVMVKVDNEDATQGLGGAAQEPQDLGRGATGELFRHEVCRRIDKCMITKRYVAEYPGDPCDTRVYPPSRLEAGKVLDFCQFAARVVMQPGFRQSCHAEEDDLVAMAAWRIIGDDLKDQGGVVMQHLLDVCDIISGMDLCLDGALQPRPVPRPSTSDLVSAFENSQSPAPYLARHFNAILERFFGDEAPCQEEAPAAKRARSTWERRCVADVPDVSFFPEEQALLAPVMVGEHGIVRAPGVSQLLKDEIMAEWRNLHKPIHSAAAVTPLHKRAEYWVRVLRFLRYCARAGRIEHGNRRGCYIERFCTSHRGRLLRYLEAKALTLSSREQRSYTARWLAGVGYWIGAPLSFAMDRSQVVMRWLCVYIEKMEVDPSFTRELILFPARPPLIPVGQVLTHFSYNLDKLAWARSVVVSTAVVAALLNALQECAPRVLPHLTEGEALERVVGLLRTDRIRNQPLCGVVEMIVALFWETGAERKAFQNKTNVDIMRSRLLAVCAVPSMHASPEPVFCFGDHINPPRVAQYVLYHFSALVLHNDGSGWIPVDTQAMLPSSLARETVGYLLRDAALEMRAVVGWSMELFKTVYDAFAAVSLVQAIPGHVEFLAARGVPVPRYAELRRGANGQPDVGRYIADNTPPVLARYDALCDGMWQWLGEAVGGKQPRPGMEPEPTEPVHVPPAEPSVPPPAPVAEGSQSLLGMPLRLSMPPAAETCQIEPAASCAAQLPDLGGALPSFKDAFGDDGAELDSFDFGKALAEEEARSGGF